MQGYIYIHVTRQCNDLAGFSAMRGIMHLLTDWTL